MSSVALPEPRTQLHKAFEGMSSRLRLAFPEDMFDLQIMSPAPSMTEWQRVTTRKPSIAIAWADIKPLPGATRQVKGSANFGVYLFVDNAEVSRRYLGDERGVGMFGMVTTASYLLHGHTIEGVGTLQVTAIGEVVKEEWADETTAVSALTVSVPMVLDNSIAGVELADFLRLGATWLANGNDAGTGVITMES